MKVSEFKSQKNNRHKREGNPKVKCNALYKKQGNFNCKLKPNEAILLARNLLQKAQLILEEDLQDGTVHLWCTGQESEILYCGVQPARKSARRKAKSK